MIALETTSTGRPTNRAMAAACSSLGMLCPVIHREAVAWVIPTSAARSTPRALASNRGIVTSAVSRVTGGMSTT